MADYTIYIRKGESVSLAVTTDDTDATEATLKVGTAGSSAQITKTATLTSGAGTIDLSTDDTDIDTGTYQYQIAITDGTDVDIFPDPTKSAQDLPDFVVTEAL